MFVTTEQVAAFGKKLPPQTGNSGKVLSTDGEKTEWIDSGGGSVSIPATAYASNSEAVAALGIGVLYKSTTLINDSPIILITI